MRYDCPVSSIPIERNEVGTYAPQIGNWLQNAGYDTTYVLHNPYLVTTSYTSVGKDKIEVAKEKYSKFEKVWNYFESYLKSGGKILPEIPSKTHIKRNIDNSVPVVALMTTHFSHKSKPSFNYHAMLVVGYDKKGVFILDPYPYEDLPSSRHMQWKEFFFGLYASSAGDPDNGGFLTITPP